MRYHATIANALPQVLAYPTHATRTKYPTARAMYAALAKRANEAAGAVHGQVIVSRVIQSLASLRALAERCEQSGIMQRVDEAAKLLSTDRRAAYLKLEELSRTLHTLAGA